MSIAQENLQRIRQSLAGQAPDKQPFLFFINFPFIKSVTDVDLHEYFNDPKTMMDAQVETFRKIGLDGPLYPDYGVVAECSALGDEIVYDEWGFPSVHADTSKEIEDLAEETKPADPWNGSLMTKALEALQYMVAHAPADFRVENCGVVGPFTTAAQHRGISEFCVDIYMEPELCEQLIEACTTTLISFCKEQEKILGKPLEHILVYDDTTSFLKPDNFRQFAMPYYDILYREFPAAQRWMHNDANGLHLSELLAEAGFVLWHTGRVFDITEARKKSDGKISLCGNLSPLEEVKNGTPAEAKAAALRQIEIFQKDPKYILSTGGFISYGTPVENVRALIAAALES